MAVTIRAGETETVSAYFTAATDIHAASSVQVGLGTYDVPPGSWVTPDSFSFSTDGKKLTVTATLGNGFLNSTGRVWLWAKVVASPQTLTERLFPTSYVFADTGGSPPTPLAPFATADQLAAETQAREDAVAAAVAGAQPVDTDLTAIAGLDSSQAGVIASDGAGWIRKTVAQLKTMLGLGTAATHDAGDFLTPAQGNANYVSGRACSTDGTDSLPTPTGVGLEFVINADGLDDIRYNGTSL